MQWFVRVVSWMVIWTVVAAAAADEPVSFRRDVAPLLLAKCQACHGPRKAEGGYRVDTFASASA
ncbi:MAG: hypothetical protein KDA41_10395, partial [Planctomycetales bacterium]|nr:hypothetical protein [Planctomycetales bacterium]